MTKSQRLAELRKLAEQATPGKRRYWVNRRDGGTHVQLTAGENDFCCRIELASTTSADIEFISATDPATIVELLDYMAAQDAALTTAREALERAASSECPYCGAPNKWKCFCRSKAK